MALTLRAIPMEGTSSSPKGDLMKKYLLKSILSSVCHIITLPTLAAQIHCQTPTLGQQFVIEVEKPGQVVQPKIEVSSFQSAARGSSPSSEFDSQRALSSLTPIRTSFTASGGLTKVIQTSGLEYRIEIKNLSELSEMDDYIAIRDNQGHEVTYPLQCK